MTSKLYIPSKTKIFDAKKNLISSFLAGAIILGMTFVVYGREKMVLIINFIVIFLLVLISNSIVDAWTTYFKKKKENEIIK